MVAVGLGLVVAYRSPGVGDARVAGPDGPPLASASIPAAGNVRD